MSIVFILSLSHCCMLGMGGVDNLVFLGHRSMGQEEPYPGNSDLTEIMK